MDVDGQIRKIKEDILNKKDYIFDKKPFTDVANIEEILETTMTGKYHIHVGEECSGCMMCTKVCPRGNVSFDGGRPIIGDDCDFCLGCVQHCKIQHYTLMTS